MRHDGGNGAAKRVREGRFCHLYRVPDVDHLSMQILHKYR